MESSPRHIRPVPGAGNQPGDAGGPTSPSPDVAPFLSAMREAAEHESRKEDLAGSKTRGAITVAGAYFAVVQTAAFASSGTLGSLAGNGRVWTIALAVGAILALTAAIGFAVAQQWPRDHTSLNYMEIGEDLTRLLNGERTEPQAVYDLARRYAEVAESRLKANNQRLGLYYATAVFCGFAVVLTTAEIAVSLLTRI
jgi:hypothetical protein